MSCSKDWKTVLRLDIIVGMSSPIGLNIIVGISSPIGLNIIIGMSSPIALDINVGISGLIGLNIIEDLTTGLVIIKISICCQA